MTPELEALEAEITRNRAVDESAIALINGIAGRIEAAKTDPAKLQQLADSLRSSSTELGDAITANTPAAEGGEGTGGEASRSRGR